MHGLDAGLAQLELEGQIEIRGIDTDEHVRLGRDQLPYQTLAPRQQLAQAPQHLDQAHHSQTLHGEGGDQALGLHARTADADEFDLRMLLLERLHQAGAEDIAGGLAGHQRHAEGATHISG